jgi:gliding motility-associatede transport system auxiliary component
MKRLSTILTREMNAFFMSAMAPVVLVGFLLLTGFSFTNTMLAYSEHSLSALKSGKMIQAALNLSDGVFQPLVSSMAIFLIFLLPAVTMRLFSEEYRSGRYDLLMTFPVRRESWVPGKFLGATAVGLVLIVSTGFFFLVAAWLGHPESGPLLAALIGLLLMVMVIVAWGTFFSTLFQYQVVSYILTFAFVMLLYMVGDLEPYLPAQLSGLAERLSMSMHLQRMTYGVMDSRDVIWFLSWTVMGLFAAMASLNSRHSAGEKRVGRWLPVLLTGVLLVLLDMIAVRSPLVVDMTRENRHSLAPQTVQVLKALDTEIEVTAFYQRLDPQRKVIEAMFANFHRENPRFRYQIVNPDNEPSLVQEKGITTIRAVVVEAENRRQDVLDPDENKLINAVFRVVDGRQPILFFMQGHGERRLDGDDRIGYAMFAQALRSQGYYLQNLLLLETGGVPDNTDVLIIAQPALEFDDAEIEAVRRYVDGGGALLLLMDPGGSRGLGDWLARFNIKPGDDFLISRSGMARKFGVDERVMVLFEYGTHSITRSMNGMATFFPFAQSLRPIKPEIYGIHAETILQSDQQSWAETDLVALGEGKAAYEEGVDLPGPQTFGVVMEIDLTKFLTGDALAELNLRNKERSTPSNLFQDRVRRDQLQGPDMPASVFSEESKSRLVVVGDSDFAANASINLYGNRDLLLNMVSWLAHEQTLIAPRAYNTASEPVILDQTQKKWLAWGSALVWPLLICIISVASILFRRMRR